MKYEYNYRLCAITCIDNWFMDYRFFFFFSFFFSPSSLSLSFFYGVEFVELLIPVATQSKAWVCGCSLAGIVGSNPARGMEVCLF